MILNTATVDFSAILPDETTTTGTATSNEVQTENLSTAIEKVKESSVTYLIEGDEAVQTVTITNNSEIELTNLTFTDKMSGSASYVDGTVTINGTAYEKYTLPGPIDLPDLAAGDSVVITYSIKADDPFTTTPITNTAVIDYTVDDPARGEVDYTDTTNEVELDIVSTKIEIVKSVDKNYAQAGETLTYTTVITNSGNTTKTGLKFIDAIPTGTEFVAESVTVDGTSEPTYNPADGFELSDLDAGDSVTIAFNVTVS